MTDNSTIEKVTKYCSRNLDFNKELGDEYFYPSLPLCVVDSVWSIGVLYESVQNVVKKFCQEFNIGGPINKNKKTHDDLTVSLVLECLEKNTDEFNAEKFFNKQRTSSRGGELKAFAVVEFLKVLKEKKVENFQNIKIEELIKDKDFENKILAIKGQSSGISLKYFFMLVGNTDLIKPDRMINAFLNEATGMGKKNKFNFDECQEILTEVVSQLKGTHFKLDARLLDYIIWDYQRTQKKA